MPSDSLLAVFGFSFLVTFGAVVSPGPVTAAILSESPRRGWQVGPLVAGGHSLLELGMVGLISLGLAAGMASPAPRLVIGVLGGITLGGIGLSYVLGAIRGTIRLPEGGAQQVGGSRGRLIGLGIVTTLSNPFWYVWWVTVAAGYLAQASAIGAFTVVAFYLGHISADFAWDSLLSTTASAGRRLLSDRAYRGLILLTGAFMVYLGAVFVTTALRARS
jgi:threonine/homoserine/homoserine lactone efflux protein